MWSTLDTEIRFISRKAPIIDTLISPSLFVDHDIANNNCLSTTAFIAADIGYAQHAGIPLIANN